MATYGSDFEAHIRDLLSSLYDYLKLAANPLADALAGEASGNERVQAIRKAVLEAIDDMRREDQQGPTARGNRLYHILRRRYVDELSTNEALAQLALSERQYYREHQRAIQTISQILWDRYFANDAREAEPAPHSLADELDWLNVDSSHRLLHPRQEIQAALVATKVIAEQSGVELGVEAAPKSITLDVSQPVFRQFVVYLLNELIGATDREGKIEIGLRLAAGAPVMSISSDALLLDGAVFCARLLQDATVGELTRHLQAELSWAAERAQIMVAFKAEVHNILIVDDNPDTVRLFKRYLANLPYQLLSAPGEREALTIARETPLLCVILDVMLPGKDGWQILQSYKSHPTTAEIPVLICSVLEMQELALSLGADGYLKKPPARAEFLAMLGEWAE